MRLWDSQTGERVKELPLGNLGLFGFSPDGRWLATNSLDGCRLWAAGSWEAGPLFEGGHVSFGPDGQTIAVEPSPGVIVLWDCESRREIVRLTAPNSERVVADVQSSFTLDGTRLVYAVSDSFPCLRTWDLRLVREHLRDLGLDWDARPLPPAPAGIREPLQVQVEWGNFRERVVANPWVQTAYQHIRGKEYDKAVAALGQAVKTDPKHAEAHNTLAWLLLTGPKELRDPKEALVLSRRAVELASGVATYHNTLGIALYANGGLREAVAELDKSLELGRGGYAAYDLFFLAMCQHRLGDAVKAKDCRERAGRWFADHRGTLPPEQVEELTQFQAEADGVLRQPPGDKGGL
jgi:Tfp pilus assembly protein PilF